MGTGWVGMAPTGPNEGVFFREFPWYLLSLHRDTQDLRQVIIEQILDRNGHFLRQNMPCRERIAVSVDNKRPGRRGGGGGGVATRPHVTKGKRKEKSLRGMNPSRRSKPTTNECMTVRDHGRTADLEATWSETSPFRPLLPSFLLPPSDKTSFGRTPRPPPRPDPNLHPSPRVVPLFRLDLHLPYYILIYIYHVGLATDSRTLVRTRNSNRELRPTYRSFRIDV